MRVPPSSTFRLPVQPYRCHLILADLRSPGRGGYSIPRGFLFDYITCANYTAEIWSWLFFSLATQSLPALVFTLAGAGQMAVWAAGKHQRLRKVSCSVMWDGGTWSSAEAPHMRYRGWCLAWKSVQLDRRNQEAGTDRPAWRHGSLRLCSRMFHSSLPPIPGTAVRWQGGPREVPQALHHVPSSLLMHVLS